MIVRSSLWLLCFFVGPVTAQQPRAALWRYTFTADDCEEGVFSNVEANETGLIRNPNTTKCEPSVGVSAHAHGQAISSMESNGYLLDKLEKLGAGITFELWLKPLDHVSTFRPILTLGAGGLAEGSGITTCDKQSIDFQLAQRGKHLEVSYRTSDAFFETCQRYLLESLVLSRDKLTHVVVTLRDGQQRIFVNGSMIPMLSRTFANDLRHWNKDFRLYLFTYRDLEAWQGILYQLTVYTGLSSPTTIQKLLTTGLPPTPPYAMNYSVTLNEDAEMIAGTHDPDWYAQPPSVRNAERIKLMAGSVNDEVRALLQSLNLTSKLAPRPIYTYITKVPPVGRLYLSDGTALEASDTTNLFPVMDVPATAVYLPPFHAHSNMTEDDQVGVFTSFQYCVTSEPTFHSQQCQPGIIHVHVVPVNDPPMAIPVPLVTVYEGLETTKTPKILLTGLDVDLGDSISWVEITEPPQYGHLILSVSSFRRDSLRHGLLLSDLSNTVSAIDPVYVKYVWNASLFSNVVHGSSVKDSFTFRVADQAGLWSTEETVDLQILSAVTAEAHVDFKVQEDSRMEGNLRWGGNDRSGYRRGIGYHVVSIPSPEEGLLLDPARSRTVVAGTMLTAKEDFRYQNGTSVTFIPAPNYCNSHEGTPIQFQFRVVAYDENNRLVSASDTTTQTVEVECTIDALNLSGPAGPFHLLEFSLYRASTDPCRGSIFDPSSSDFSVCKASTIVEGIEVARIDSHSEKVLVTVFAGNGYLTFNKQYWNLTQPIHGRRAVAADHVSFLAAPWDLTTILSYLHFESFVKGEDSIDIFLQYGNCSDIEVNRTAMAFSSMTCQVLRHSIHVMVERDESLEMTETQLTSGFPWQILLCMLGYPALYYIYVQLESAYHQGHDETVADDEDLELPTWIEHQTEDGEFYYENTRDGTVTWLAPVGEEILAAWDTDNEEEEKTEIA